MRKKWSLKSNNVGASLIAVITAIVFVSVIGLVITQITITNIQMKEVEQQTKKQFYSAEVVLDDLKAGMDSLAAQALQSAYTGMLSQYHSVTSSGGSVKEAFSRLYLDSLITAFGAASETGNAPMQKHVGDDPLNPVFYEVGYYSWSKIEGCFSVPEYKADAVAGRASLLTTAVSLGSDSVKYYRADYTTGTLVLEGIQITSTDDAGYTTTIQTDVVFHTPDVNFGGSNLVKNFMRYSLIADKEINVNNPGIKVKGSVYAGEDGIVASNNTAEALFTGNDIVTRGDIVATSGAKLTVGNGTSRIWAENVRTKQTPGSTASAELTLDGNCYISDDLEMDGKNSIVNLKGYYYGYNFQKNYGAASTDVSAQYSSAIVVNARECKLDMTGLKYLHLAGKTYLSRNAGTADVPLGESVSVRSNQFAYYVPTSFLDLTGEKPVFTDVTVVSNYYGVTNINSYVKTSEPVIAYYYKDISGGTSVAYYLNFAGDQAANDFFADYYASNKEQTNDYADNYLADDSIVKFSDSWGYSLRGDLMYRDANDGKKINVERTTINSGLYGVSGSYYSWAASQGVNYKALQMYLEDSHDGITAADIRFGADNDKTTSRLLNNLMDVDKFKLSLADQNHNAKIVSTSTYNGETCVVVLIDNVGNGAYVLPSTYKYGIIIATGDVQIFSGPEEAGRQFSGMIISGGEITFATGAAVESNEALVSKLFADDLKKTKSDFAYLFTGYNLVDESAAGEIDIKKYTTYDNWTKTIQ